MYTCDVSTVSVEYVRLAECVRQDNPAQICSSTINPYDRSPPDLIYETGFSPFPDRGHFDRKLAARHCFPGPRLAEPNSKDGMDSIDLNNFKSVPKYRPTNCLLVSFSFQKDKAPYAIRTYPMWMNKLWDTVPLGCFSIINIHSTTKPGYQDDDMKAASDVHGCFQPSSNEACSRFQNFFYSNGNSRILHFRILV